MNDTIGVHTFKPENVSKGRFLVIANCEERSRKQIRLLIINGLLRTNALAMTERDMDKYATNML